jgi:hypothetical protein
LEQFHNSALCFVNFSDAFDLECGVGILRLPEGLGMGLEALDATIFNDPTDAATDEGQCWLYLLSIGHPTKENYLG